MKPKAISIIESAIIKPTFLVIIGLLVSFCDSIAKPKVLVFTKTAGFYHESIEPGKAAIIQLGKVNGFDVDTTSNAEWFKRDGLEKYAAVIFLNTTGDVLNSSQEKAFEYYIQSGGGFVGVHSAADTEYDWQWYGGLVGAYFKSHPKQQKAQLNILDNAHLSTRHLGTFWTHFDEWYNFKNISTGISILMTIDENSYEGGENGDNHPMAWYRNFDGGRSFYTGLGHTDEDYSNPLFLKHLLGGIQYAMEVDNKK